MVPEFEEVTFNLEKDKVSEPFKSSFGYHIVKLTGIKAEQIKPLSEVKKEIRKNIHIYSSCFLYSRNSCNNLPIDPC